jgi:hypothetical protein
MSSGRLAPSTRPRPGHARKLDSFTRKFRSAKAAGSQAPRSLGIPRGKIPEFGPCDYVISTYIPSYIRIVRHLTVGFECDG